MEAPGPPKGLPELHHVGFLTLRRDQAAASSAEAPVQLLHHQLLHDGQRLGGRGCRPEPGK
eukprot:8739869-Heterocapsa_arctica.AAC.1